MRKSVTHKVAWEPRGGGADTPCREGIGEEREAGSSGGPRLTKTAKVSEPGSMAGAQGPAGENANGPSSRFGFYILFLEKRQVSAKLYQLKYASREILLNKYK